MHATSSACWSTITLVRPAVVQLPPGRWQSASTRLRHQMALLFQVALTASTLAATYWGGKGVVVVRRWCSNTTDMDALTVSMNVCPYDLESARSTRDPRGRRAHEPSSRRRWRSSWTGRFRWFVLAGLGVLAAARRVLGLWMAYASSVNCARRGARSTRRLACVVARGQNAALHSDSAARPPRFRSRTPPLPRFTGVAQDRTPRRSTPRVPLCIRACRRTRQTLFPPKSPVTILMPRSSVCFTGHRSAISSRRSFCSSVSAPCISILRSMRAIPTAGLLAGLAIHLVRRATSASSPRRSSSGQPLRLAYSRSVIARYTHRVAPSRYS